MTPSAVTTTRAVHLARPVRGHPEPDDFTLVEEPLPRLADGKALVRVDALSLDPYLRSLLDNGHLDDPPIRPGEPMAGRALGTVLASDSLPAGTRVLGETGWREHAVLPVAALTPVEVPTGAPPSAMLGILGMPGLTAFAAHARQLLPRAGETVVVSSATGGVGSLAGQLARRAGARTVAIVGSTGKVALARSLGYDEVVVRTAPDWISDLHAACPDRVDAYLHMGDQATLDGVAEHLAIGARVSLCGLIDQSNGAPPTRLRAGALMAARATAVGMVVYDHLDLAEAHRREVGDLLARGEIRLVEDVWDGLENAGAAFAALLAGRNHGKVIVEIAATPSPAQGEQQ
ncbi:NADP-dependent oxidoreductase [Nocardioides dubius]|uniref:NADP-dependent oxidoreductase n=1 Tax=Nocardioides dubius TaxID=317019 RepID=A0ABP4EGA6_9ACTN